MKILVIIPYFGKWPPWIDYFLQSCSFNSSIHWLLYTDCEMPNRYYNNIRFENKSLNDFNILAGKNLNLHINILNPYKICDLRPAFGHIFKDYLVDYNYWGYADIDLVFGNIMSFLPKDVLNKHSVISVRKNYQAGHFALYKNSPEVNSLYIKSKLYKEIFQDSSHHYSFDERSNFLGRKLPSRPGGVENWRKFYYKIPVLQKIWVRLKPTLLKTQFPDITTITKISADLGEISIYRKDLVRSDIWFRKNNIRNWKITWKNGSVMDNRNGKELLHFHFIKSKNNKHFKIEPFKFVNEFTIRPNGIEQV